MPSNSDRIRVTVDLPRHQYKTLHDCARYRLVSHSDLIREAVDRECGRIQRKIQETAVQYPPTGVGAKKSQ